MKVDDGQTGQGAAAESLLSIWFVMILIWRENRNITLRITQPYSKIVFVDNKLRSTELHSDSKSPISFGYSKIDKLQKKL